MMSRIAWGIVATALMAQGCARRVPEPPGVPAGQPHVSWVIMYGDRDNPDAEFACQSTGPRECAIPSTREGQRVFSDVHLYYHGAGQETVYKGTYSIEFLGDAPPRIVSTSITVRGEEQIENQTVTGLVTTTPGRYMVRLVFDAAPKDRPSQAVREVISITVS